ncbi:AraC family transcriptional regulator [Enterococcus florum]|uniref:AraC family transcriptional regulator n=1 Tax=Enterococcus florum TaxID=2480627 RepID=A0A4P5PCN0_9ENTE|nr:AraC family transcriptional regulator [Enterococcus florum]GCF93728.1 AraC family transcriptional regulator [Enterococcus florum]
MRIKASVYSTIAYVEDHLSSPLFLEKIAEELNYSKFYLLSEFSRSMRVTLYDYIKRRRLSKASKELLVSDKKIIDIAVAAGYQSQQSFHKAFLSFYKTTPKRFRLSKQEFFIQSSFLDYGQLLNDPAPLFHCRLAIKSDIVGILHFMKQVRGGFPYWNEACFSSELERAVTNQSVTIVTCKNACAAVLLYNRKTRHIDGFAALPIFWDYFLEKQMLEQLIQRENLQGKKITTTTFRSKDKLDIGFRLRLKRLGFTPQETLREFGYPTEKMLLTIHN